MKIAIDAMGGDYAPSAIVEGAYLASRDYSIKSILVGDKDRIAKELAKYQETNNIEIHHASEIVDMKDPPTTCLRKKKDSSIKVAVELVKEGKARAYISAGNTGAAMAAGLMILKPLKGLDRPAIAQILPTLKGSTVLLDVGANVDCKVEYLVQFAIMGSIYAKKLLNIKNPTVGLLSVGTEDIKGNERSKKALAHLRKMEYINFVGNVEGRDIYNGSVDVVACDGFVGNVALKLSEGLAEMIHDMLKMYLNSNIFTKIGYLLSKSAYIKLKKKINYEEYGGAPLLGVNGNGIICHGASSAKAIKNAISLASNICEQNLNNNIIDELESLNIEVGDENKSKDEKRKNKGDSI
ncbi:phosphate acyltransferase PlsX [bacterium]|nr:phosphate acyltransferase PlsX [bacterium]